jgi:hypothetical protein
VDGAIGRWGLTTTDAMPRDCEAERDGTWTRAEGADGEVAVYVSATGYLDVTDLVTLHADDPCASDLEHLDITLE